MATREEMLDRVRKALGRPNTGSPAIPLPPLDLTGVMPPLAPEDYLAKFEAEWEKVAGVAYRVARYGRTGGRLPKDPGAGGNPRRGTFREPFAGRIGHC